MSFKDAKKLIVRYAAANTLTTINKKRVLVFALTEDNLGKLRDIQGKVFGSFRRTA